ncbi:MAG TPA: glycosyltransferase family 4 protein [Verrucomicrobiae bacterium]|jgi:glycosyltransferase involved in cell wall biosynthesis
MTEKTPIRILFVSEPGRYGVFLVVQQLIRFMHTRHPEISVDLAYSSRRSWPATAELAEEVRAHGGEAIDLNVGNAPELRDFPALLHLRKLIRRRRPQLIHCHSSKAGGLCRLLAALPGMPPVLYSPNAYYGMAKTGGKKEKFFNWIESWFGRTGHSHVVSADERRFGLEILKLPPRSLILINNGIATERFTAADAGQKNTARDQLGIPREGKLLITTGRDSAQKNYAPLYAALNRLMVADPKIFFAHAGSGSEQLRAGLAPAQRPRCFAYEFMADVRPLLWAADGFILTSFYEGLSVAMLEAVSCGLPLLLTDAPGIAGMGKYGLDIDWLPNPKTCDHFEAEVLQALTAWSRRPTPARPAQHAAARQHFNASTQADKVVRTYRWLIQTRKS